LQTSLKPQHFAATDHLHKAIPTLPRLGTPIQVFQAKVWCQ
jgi:hypothetical protein